MAIERKYTNINKQRILVFQAIEAKLNGLKWMKLLIIAMLTAYLGAWAFFSADNELLIYEPDPSWEMGLPAAFNQGDIVGRDIFFTYGPLYQLITSGSSKLNVQNSPVDGILISRIVIVDLSIIILGLCMLLMRPIGGFQTLLIYFCMAVFGMLQPMSIRVITGLLAILVYYRSLISPNRGMQLLTASVAGGLAFIAQLLSFDVGIYAISAIILISVLYALASHIHWMLPMDKDNYGLYYLRMLGLAIGFYLTANLLISFLFTVTSSLYPSFFAYQFLSLDIIANYSRTLGRTWELGLLSTIVLFIVVISTVIMALIRIKKAQRDEGLLFMCLLVYSLVMLKSAMTRADLPHIMYGTLPIILTFLAIGKPYMSRINLIVWVVILTAFAATWIRGTIEPVKFGLNLLQGRYSTEERWYTLQNGNQSQLSDPLSELLVQRPSKPLLAFPYQNYIPAIADRKMIAPFLQTYAAVSKNLQEQYIARLNQESDRYDVIFGLDQLASWKIDDVQSITRTPVIFEYIYNNFRLADPNAIADGYLLLDYRDHSTVLKGYPLKYTTSKDNNDVTISLEQPAQCSLIKMIIQINYPIYIVIGHASPIHLEIYSRSDVIAGTNVVDINNSKPFNTYISLLSPFDFYQVFGDSIATQVSWDRLVLSNVDGGLFGFNPRSVSIGEIECISTGGTD